MIIVNVSKLRMNLSKYLKMVEDGEEIIIYRRGRKVAKISLYKKKKSFFGCAKHLFHNGFTLDNLKDGFEDIPELFGY